MILTAIDLETTGLESGFHEICSLSAIKFDTNEWKILSEFNIKVRPAFIHRVDERALRINGNTIEKLKIFTRIHIAKSKFLTWYNNLYDEKIIPVAHNWAFDKSFLEVWFGREIFQDVFSYQPYCTKSMANYLKLKGKIPKNINSSLESLSEYFGIPHNSNNAHNDVNCCLLLLKEMLSL